MRWAIVLLACATPAHADPLDDLGFGASATAMANSRMATATGAEAAHTNPAGVANAARPELLLGWQFANERLELDDHDAGVRNAHGTSIGFAIPVDIANLHLATGVALYLPGKFLSRLEQKPVGEPQFVRFESAAQRVVVEPVAALSLGRVAIGAGASLIADARSKELAVDVGAVGDETQSVASLDVGLPVRAAPFVGVWYRPARAVELAATFRGELALDVALDLRTNARVPGAVTGDAIVSLRSVSYFTPMRAVAAAAVHATDDLVLTADIAWERWSALGSGVPDVRVLIALDLAPPLASTMQPPASFKDIVTPRVGAEWKTGALRLRAGAAYLPSPVPPQTGITSFADGARTLATLGAGWRFPPGRVIMQPIDLDLALGWQHLKHEVVQKDPGAFSSGGDILQASLSSTVRF